MQAIAHLKVRNGNLGGKKSFATEKVYSFTQVCLEFASHQKRKSRHNSENLDGYVYVYICDIRKMQI